MKTGARIFRKAPLAGLAGVVLLLLAMVFVLDSGTQVRGPLEDHSALERRVMAAVADEGRLLKAAYQPDAKASGIVTAATSLEAKARQEIAASPGFPMQGHEQIEGPVLSVKLAQNEPIEHDSQRCPENAPVKRYEVLAINVKIVLNRWGDNDPEGHMYVLSDQIDAVRAQEAAVENEHFGLTLGAGADPVQPLTIRANVGDCVRVTFTNELEENPDTPGSELAPASFHVHGADLVLSSSGEPALTTNPESVALPGRTIDYEWYIDPDYYGERTHRIQSHGPKLRYQVSHGLFGALVVEPTGSNYLDPRTGADLCQTSANDDGSDEKWCRNSWDAIIDPGDANGDGERDSDFREFALFYHEIGHDGFLPRNKSGQVNPFIDAVTESYQPNGRAINYHSESFFRRMGEAEVMAKILDISPDSEFTDSAKDAYDYRSDKAREIWQKLELGIRGDLKKFADEAQAYGTYAFGEPAMPIPQSYVGDPTKFRIVHGGSETFHVPHLHGGGIQWQRQPNVGKDPDNPNYTPIDAGLKKVFANKMPSSATDAQSIGPSETYDFEVACGSGGCQQTVGDFLFHCHVASHYISGMWHFWRVYNTLQDQTNKTDELPVLAELPDRTGAAKGAVDSVELLGQAVDFAGRTFTVSADNVELLVETQLPPKGEQETWQDASVMDWDKERDDDGKWVYLNEPDTHHVWPNFQAANPGARHEIKFDPETGKLAYPLLRPHLGKRPPFAPNHGPSPYLEPLGHANGEPALPGTNGVSSLCPAGAPQRTYKIHAIQTPIQTTDSVLDEKGMLFVVKDLDESALAEGVFRDNEERARNTDEYKVPLAIRANQGDCVDLILVNELEETGELAELSKTNIHQHFFQFDTQASDGVISGSSFEQSIRPFRDKGLSSAILKDADTGATEVRLNDVKGLKRGVTVAVGIDQTSGIFETAVIADVNKTKGTVTFDAPLENPHAAGELVSTEFVRYRWYAARQTGASYFHDHVDALKRWGHGLFGTIIGEPKDSTWHHPVSGDEIPYGPIRDIHVDNSVEVLPGLQGSFREYVLFFTDRTVTQTNESGKLTENDYVATNCSGGAMPAAETGLQGCNTPGSKRAVTGTINLRAEPLKKDSDRGQGPAHLALSSVTHGDPKTPVLRAYAGDPLMFRLLTTATEEVHPFHITGHHFRWERFQENSPPLTTFGVGISERFNAYVAAAGGAGGKAGDYLYQNGTHRHFLEGNWGILRVFDTLQADLKPLPGAMPPVADGGGGEFAASFPSLTWTNREPPQRPINSPGNVCPANAPVRGYAVSAIEQGLLFENTAVSSSEFDSNGRGYVLDDDLVQAGRNLPGAPEDATTAELIQLGVEAARNGDLRFPPLVIRANAGDCVELVLSNRLSDRLDRRASLHLAGPAVDPQASLGITLGFNPDQTVAPGGQMTYRYYSETELGAVLLRDFGNPRENVPSGLYGALIVEPAGSTYHDPYSGEELASGLAAVIRNPELPDFREFAVLYHDADPDIGTFTMPYEGEVDKMTLVNYRAQPLRERLRDFDVLFDADAFKVFPEQIGLTQAQYDDLGETQKAKHLRDVMETARGVFGHTFEGAAIKTDVFEAFAGDAVRFRVLSAYSEQPQMFSVEGHVWPLTPGIEGTSMVSTRYLPSTGVLNVELRGVGGPGARSGDYMWSNDRMPHQKIGQWGLMRVLPAGDEATNLLPLSGQR